MSLHITKLIYTRSKTDKHEEQLTEITSKFSAYETRLDKLSTANINKIDIEMKEHEDILNTKTDKNIDDLKAVAYSSINQKFSPPDSHNSRSYYNQTSDGITKSPLLKSPYFHSHDLQFTKHLSPMTLEGETLLQNQKLWDSIRYAL